MGIKKILSLSVLAFLTVSCASTSTDSDSVEDVYVPSFKNLSHKGFNLVVPDDSGWNVANEKKKRLSVCLG